VFALLALTVLVVPAIGRPTEDVEETATTVKHGIRSWLKNVQAKIVKHEENCTHNVVRWVKDKLGLTKKATTEKPTTTTTTNTNSEISPEETDYSGGYVPITSVVNPEEPAGEGYAAGPDEEVPTLDDTPLVTETGNDSGNESDVLPTYPSAVENAVDPVDPDIDVRGKF